MAESETPRLAKTIIYALRHLDDLVDVGLLERAGTPALTDKGRELALQHEQEGFTPTEEELFRALDIISGRMRPRAAGSDGAHGI